MRRAVKEVRNDLGGDKPFDLMYSGQDAIITADMTRMNLGVYYSIANAGAPLLVAAGGAPALAGVEGPGETGTLIGTEGQSLTLWVVFANAAKTAYQNAANGNMPIGYRFPVATLEGPDDLDIGMRPFKIHTVFHAIRGFVPSTTSPGSGAIGGAFTLYDYNLSGLGAPN